jgi:putative phosphoribosyl transferase
VVVQLVSGPGMENLPFRDRAQAGQLLSQKLKTYADSADLIVLALPRGGVPVGYEIAKALHVPLDVFLVRKLGVPGQEELAMGAIAIGGVRFLNEEVIRVLNISTSDVDTVAARETRELARRDNLYRGDRKPPDLAGRTVILVDDGLATGSTMRAAVAAVRQKQPKRIVVAVPVAAFPTCRDLAGEVEQVVSLETPEPFYSVGCWYEDFSQTSDDEIRGLLERASRQPSPAA